MFGVSDASTAVSDASSADPAGKGGNVKKVPYYYFLL